MLKLLEEVRLPHSEGFALFAIITVQQICRFFDIYDFHHVTMQSFPDSFQN